VSSTRPPYFFDLKKFIIGRPLNDIDGTPVPPGFTYSEYPSNTPGEEYTGVLRVEMDAGQSLPDQYKFFAKNWNKWVKQKAPNYHVLLEDASWLGGSSTTHTILKSVPGKVEFRTYQGEERYLINSNIEKRLSPFDSESYKYVLTNHNVWEKYRDGVGSRTLRFISKFLLASAGAGLVGFPAYLQGVPDEEIVNSIIIGAAIGFGAGLAVERFKEWRFLNKLSNDNYELGYTVRVLGKISKATDQKELRIRQSRYNPRMPGWQVRTLQKRVDDLYTARPAPNPIAAPIMIELTISSSGTPCK